MVNCTSVVAAFKRNWITDSPWEDWQGSIEDAGKPFEVIGWSRTFPDSSFEPRTAGPAEATPSTTTLTNVFVSQKYLDN